MKKNRTFMLIFLGLVAFVSVLHVLSTDRANARNSIRLLLRNFIGNDNTRVRIIYCKTGEITKERQVEYSREFLRIIGPVLYKHVTEESKLTKLTERLSGYVRVELDNGDSKYLLDFPTTEPGYDFVMFTDSVYGNQYVFYLNCKSRRKMRVLLE